MQIDFQLFLQIMVYILLIALIIIFIILGIKAIKMLSKVDTLIDDVEEKIQKADNVFGIIDRVTDYTSNMYFLTDTVLGTGIGNRKGVLPIVRE